SIMKPNIHLWAAALLVTALSIPAMAQQAPVKPKQDTQTNCMKHMPMKNMDSKSMQNMHMNCMDNMPKQHMPMEGMKSMKGMKNMPMQDMQGTTQDAQVSAKGMGVVKAVDTAQGTVTIKHQAIAALHWPAMTMTFKAAKPELLEGVKAGEKVRFGVHAEGM